MSEKISYRQTGNINREMPLEPFYNALLPFLEIYGITAEFPADKPSTAYSTYGIQYSTWIGEPPNVIHYVKNQESPYSMGADIKILGGNTLFHNQSGEGLFLRIEISDYAPNRKPGYWLTIEFKGEKNQIETLRNALETALTQHNFESSELEIKPLDQEDMKNLEKINSDDSEGKFEENPKPSDGVNFDALSLKATETNTTEDLTALFGAAFALPEWHFIARGEFPNVNPYIASNPQYADNKPMVRAFTDSKRLIRFAKENNLTRADGTCDSLTIPTGNIVQYLEGFIPQGAYGVWFNSDTESEGFFIPLKQLLPIKEHLAKFVQQKKDVQIPELETLHVVVKEGLLMPTTVVIEIPYKTNFFCRVPSDWIENGHIKEMYLEKIERQVFGEDRRSENISGASYIIMSSHATLFTPEMMKTHRWSGIVNDDDNLYYFFIASEDGEIKKVTAEEFQANIDASFQTPEKPAGQMPRANLQNWGLAESPDGEIDLNLNINQVGAVDFDTSIAPFYEAIVPLLKDYQGTDEYITLLAFDPNGMSQLVESIAENAHGVYLQIRRFFYLNPKNNVRIGVNSIHSRYLRHIQTNAELLVSFELCKNLDNQTAAFYYRFEGPKSEVLKLTAAIQPILQQCRFEAVLSGK